MSLRLRFKPGQRLTFRATHETARSVKWTGVSPKEGKEFKGGTTGQTAVMVFDEKVMSVDPNQGAILEITIKALKFKSVLQDKTMVDYDSESSSSQDTALAGLVGQHYSIHQTPTGRVTRVVEARAARAALNKEAPHIQMALRLLTDQAIEKRHSLQALPPGPPVPLRPRQTWSASQTFSFSMMGRRAFTKNYTFKGVEDQGDLRIARVDMEAVPSVTPTQQADENSAFLQMFDNMHQYSGYLELDVTRGRVRTWAENMQIQWAYLDPSSVDKEGQAPRSVHMTARENIGLECLD